MTIYCRHASDELEQASGSTPDSIPADSVMTPESSTDHDYNAAPRLSEDLLQACNKRIEELENQLEREKQSRFFLERFSNDNSSIIFFTGFKDYATLMAVFSALQPTATTMVRWSQVQRFNGRQTQNVACSVFRDESVALVDQFFMFLCRVRQGFFEQDLALRFNISQSTVSRILITWANYLYFMLGSLPLWSTRSANQEQMPDCFKQTYPNTRVILDATEIRVQTPSSKVLNSETYSSYKSHTTFKSLVGISPFGAITFISSLYTGCISDKEITRRSGILNLLEEGDEVMADKGFTINDLLVQRKATLVIPPFLGLKGKFSKQEVSDTHQIARLRIHVERAIRRVKEYHIFDSVIPLSLAGSVNQLWTICAILTNFKGALF